MLSGRTTCRAGLSTNHHGHRQLTARHVAVFRALVDEAVERARAAARPAPATVGEYVYKSAALAGIPG